MCGRYAIISAPEAIRRFFGYEEQPNFPPRHNVAPTQPIPVVRLVDGRRQFALMRWGLVPAWVKDPRDFSLVIQGRGETVLEKPAFRAAMRYRRCLIPADGYYEWKRDGATKRPHYIQPASGDLMAFAGLWETWTGPNGEQFDSVAVVTTQANRALAALHDRMPVIVPPEAFDLWLDCTRVDAKTAATLIAPAPDDLLRRHEVSPAVNRAANEGPELIAPAPEESVAHEAPSAAKPKGRRAKPTDDKQPSLF